MMRPADGLPGSEDSENGAGRVIPPRGAGRLVPRVIRRRSVLAGAAVGRGVPHAITFDPYSLMIDGDRTFIWPGEFHPSACRAPSLWLDVLEKMEASGVPVAPVFSPRYVGGAGSHAFSRMW